MLPWRGCPKKGQEQRFSHNGRIGTRWPSKGVAPATRGQHPWPEVLELRGGGGLSNELWSHEAYLQGDAIVCTLKLSLCHKLFDGFDDLLEGGG